MSQAAIDRLHRPDLQDSALIKLWGKAMTTADCGAPALVGKSHTLGCEISGEITNGINWFRGVEKIITCFKEGFCISSNREKYQVFPEAHSATSHQFIINKITEEDMEMTWSCVDDTKLSPTMSVSSSCKIKREYDIVTTADCGDEVDEGKPHVLTCRMRNPIAHGITWFRNRDSVLICSKDLKCVVPVNKQGLYAFSSTNNLSSILLIIASVSADDLQHSWSCIVGSSYPPTIPTSSTCRLKQAHLSGCETALIVVIILAIIAAFVVGLSVWYCCKTKRFENSENLQSD
ncbi:hypothetical protein LOTGIDRAFT_234557 [Lottia gigantea]|uniref:Ig-like domain-containing protein n=1 Tax=Lottia gigantea TaxID=225164 RepID=V4A0Q4_LOTGI|nr:hypothetical protein LOTGIDRAFT_234557 [Lottia gigantea]ESO88505.1 hypothetical protein LOTGIDRAFT_234557 [Lottia gigantea]